MAWRMPRVVITTAVEDLESWLERAPSRGEVFRLLTKHPVDYGVTESGEVVMSIQTDDLSSFFDTVRSQVFIEHCAVDGIRLETVKIFVLDRTIDPA